MDQGSLAARAAKSLKRPQSRASTASIHSATTLQHNMDGSGFTNTSGIYAGQWMHSEHAHTKSLPAAQMSPEDLILQAAAHMQSANHEFVMDSSMAAHMHHMAYQHQQPHGISRDSLPGDQFTVQANFSAGDSQMLDRDDNDDGDSITLVAGVSKPARSSANNELEMRQLFSANKHRGLQDVAAELHGNERGPNSERTRQVFAMLWINSVCTKGKGSVPRGRVYANYASRCATERITVLNPASFGKLVRVLFPGLKTRRLGVRGESKYHYVNFALAEDQSDVAEPPQPPRAMSENNYLSQGASAESKQSAGSKRGLSSSQLAREPRKKRAIVWTADRSHSLYNQPDLASMDNMQSTSTKTLLELEFPPVSQDSSEQSERLCLPAIEAFLPHGTDPDAAKSLSALYRSHCTSLVECIRYCREKTFFHLYTSFQGTLTMPVQKLFSHEAIAQWIEGCDYILYQRMMRIISGLTLQVVPKPVLDTLRNISERLVPHIRESFQGQPQHVVAAKEAPAALFSGLINRALRVNLTAHAAANMLSNPANRDQMYVDWITMIRTRKVAECVPTRGMDDVVHLLVSEMRHLLDPVNVPWEVEVLTIYGDIASRNPQQWTEDGAVSTGQNVLDRWVNFLRSLPAKFSYASHSDVVWCVERVGTAVMRDLTLAQGKSFGSWWVTKTWVDEMVCFIAEQGGFMKHKRVSSAVPSHNVEASGRGASHQNSRHSNTSDHVDMAQSQPGRAPFPPPTSTKNGGNTKKSTSEAAMENDAHDDSGIGIRTPDEDFAMQKQTYAESETPVLIGAAELTAGGNI